MGYQADTFFRILRREIGLLLATCLILVFSESRFWQQLISSQPASMPTRHCISGSAQILC